MDAKINEDVKNKKQDNLITAEIRYKMTAKGMMQEPEKTDSGKSTARYGWRCIDGVSSGRSGDIFP